MKTLGEAAMDLPWLNPSVASITTLARSTLSTAWTQVRSDPGIALLSAHLFNESPTSRVSGDVAILEAILQHQADNQLGIVDWNQAGPADVHRVCHRQAFLAAELAERVGCDERQAWVAAFLAPLGWLALAAVDPAHIAEHIDALRKNTDTCSWQRCAWGLDHGSLARRLCRSWRLPHSLATIISHLGLPADIAERLGVEVRLFQVVKLAVTLIQEAGNGLGLPIGASSLDLLGPLHLEKNEVEKLTVCALATAPPTLQWESPAQHPLLIDLLRLSLENRRQNDSAWIERLQQELDYLQEALVRKSDVDDNRLNNMKLASLAELAAGAGHEINNPLAVISGQAQYVLKQMDWLNVPAEEIENVGEYLDNLRSKVAPSLQKIIGQTQRIHSILKELMQFARPLPPDFQHQSASELIDEVAGSLQSLAGEHQVQLLLPDIAVDEILHVDPAQARVALSGILRNAIEAAPAGGWARIRLESHDDDLIAFIVEDNGAGPDASALEHLFDPFFSGRSAGRGRGMGLPTAWRLARQQGGDLSFAGAAAGTTRFVLTLRLAQSVHIHGRTGTHVLTLVRSA